MAQMPTLVVLHVSPWSERVKWALDHHGIAYRLVQHAPFLGERKLRRIVGKREGRVTVPVLVDADTVLGESWDIVKHAERNGSGAPLVPFDREGRIREWVTLADETSNAGRAIVVRALLHSPGALDESVPPPAPTWIRPLFRPFTRFGTRWFARKYGLDLADTSVAEAKVRANLDRLRAGLAGGAHLLDDFTYADIAMASVLQGIRPVADEWLRLGPATRETWTTPTIAADYEDLLRWRDELYREHRKARVKG